MIPCTVAILGSIDARYRIRRVKSTPPPLRRIAALRLGALALAGALAPWRVRAQPAPTGQEQQADLDREVAKRLPGIRLTAGKVRIEIAEFAENGYAVPCTITVDSPMTPDEHVRALYMWAARNPRPFVIEARLGPSNPRARLQTRLRLGDSERLLAIAEMSDGSFWSGFADVRVQVSACEDGSG